MQCLDCRLFVIASFFAQKVALSKMEGKKGNVDLLKGACLNGCLIHQQQLHRNVGSLEIWGCKYEVFHV